MGAIILAHKLESFPAPTNIIIQTAKGWVGLEGPNIVLKTQFLPKTRGISQMNQAHSAKSRRAIRMEEKEWGGTCYPSCPLSRILISQARENCRQNVPLIQSFFEPVCLGSRKFTFLHLNSVCRNLPCLTAVLEHAWITWTCDIFALTRETAQISSKPSTFKRLHLSEIEFENLKGMALAAAGGMGGLILVGASAKYLR